jgi:DHA1 family bicyclomycin/chloramphenicol resistance-like MFS transporter
MTEASDAQPIDPRSRRARIVIPLVIAGLAMIGPFSIDSPFPAFGRMADEFAVTSTQMQLVVTSYMLAFAVMSIFHGPLSDAVGRKPMLTWGVGVYAVASFATAFAPSFGWLLFSRVLQGLSAGAGVIVSRTVIRDLFDGKVAQRLMSRVAMIFGIAPAIAPIVAGGLLQIGDWPLIFAFQAGFGLLLIVLVVIALPETHPPERRTPLRVGAILRSMLRVTRSPAVWRLSLASGLVFGGSFLYIGGAALVVEGLLGLGELDYWQFFVPMIGGMVVGAWISGRAAGVITGRRLVSYGLAFCLAMAVLSIVIAALPLGGSLPWAIVGPSLVMLGTGMAYPTLQLMLLDVYPAARGAVVSFATFLTLVINATAAATITPLAARSLLTLALTAFAMGALGALSWAWHVQLERRIP